MNKWKIEYDNDTGAGDEGFLECWTVTDGDKSFKCDEEADAKWLCELLNVIPPNILYTLNDGCNLKNKLNDLSKHFVYTE